MTPSPWLYAYLKRREGFRPTAYRDTGKVWTIGYGHTHGVKPGDTCTTDQGQDFLEADVAYAAEHVSRLVSVPLTQPQFDALVSFVYNLGPEALVGTHTLAALNAGHYAAFADDMLSFDHDNGKVVEGLLNRRKDERARFLEAA